MKESFFRSPEDVRLPVVQGFVHRHRWNEVSCTDSNPEDLRGKHNVKLSCHREQTTEKVEVIRLKYWLYAIYRVQFQTHKFYFSKNIAEKMQHMLDFRRIWIIIPYRFSNWLLNGFYLQTSRSRLPNLNQKQFLMCILPGSNDTNDTILSLRCACNIYLNDTCILDKNFTWIDFFVVYYMFPLLFYFTINKCFVLRGMGI